jgi:hypothetical protein
MSEEQEDMLHFLLLSFKDAKPTTHSVVEFMHGDCTGSDEQSHEIARYLGYRITIIPQNTLPQFRAHCVADEELPAMAPLDRNRVIVDWSELMLCALTFPQRRSGAWYTYNYAMSTKKRAWIL